MRGLKSTFSRSSAAPFLLRRRELAPVAAKEERFCRSAEKLRMKEICEMGQVAGCQRKCYPCISAAPAGYITQGGYMYSNILTVIIRNDGPMIHCGDSPSYRSIKIALTAEQHEQFKHIDKLEQISKCFIEMSMEELERVPK
jgi:hypothetical protein